MTGDYILDEPFEKIGQNQCLLLEEGSLADELIQPNLGALLEAVIDLKKRLTENKNQKFEESHISFFP